MTKKEKVAQLQRELAKLEEIASMPRYAWVYKPKKRIFVVYNLRNWNVALETGSEITARNACFLANMQISTEAFIQAKLDISYIKQQLKEVNPDEN